MNDKLNELLYVAKAHAKTIWDTCSSIWEFISEKPENEQELYFSLFLSQLDFEDIEIKDYKEYLDGALSNITPDIDRLEKRIVSNMVQQNIPEDRFYQNLWYKICDTTLLLEQSAQIAFLARLWLDLRVPYYQIDEGCTMENEEFSSIRKKISPLLKKAYFILAIPFRQRTQRASLLISLADEIENEREKVVFWANVIAQLTAGVNHQKTDDKMIK